MLLSPEFYYILVTTTSAFEDADWCKPRGCDRQLRRGEIPLMGLWGKSSARAWPFLNPWSPGFLFYTPGLLMAFLKPLVSWIPFLHPWSPDGLFKPLVS
jgi:hypothetical protein